MRRSAAFPAPAPLSQERLTAVRNLVSRRARRRLADAIARAAVDAARKTFTSPYNTAHAIASLYWPDMDAYDWTRQNYKCFTRLVENARVAIIMRERDVREGPR